MIRGVITYDNIPEYFKGWGSEKWIHNDKDYCGKELILFEDKNRRKLFSCGNCLSKCNETCGSSNRL